MSINYRDVVFGLITSMMLQIVLGLLEGDILKEEANLILMERPTSSLLHDHIHSSPLTKPSKSIDHLRMNK